MKIAYCVFVDRTGDLNVEMGFELPGEGSYDWREYLGEDMIEILAEGYYEIFFEEKKFVSLLEQLFELLRESDEKHGIANFFEAIVRRPLVETVGKLALQKHLASRDAIKDAMEGRR